MAELDYSRLLRIIEDSGIPRKKPATSIHVVQDGNYKVTFTADPEKGLMYGDDLRTLQWMLLHAIEHDMVHGRLCLFSSYKAALLEIGLPASRNEKWLHRSLDRVCSARVDVEEPGTVHTFAFVIVTRFWLDDDGRLIDLEFPDMHEITLTEDATRLAFELEALELEG